MTYVQVSSLRRPVILDLGCGEGIKIRRFDPSGTYVGVDPDLESVERVREKKPDGLAVVARAEQLPFPDSTFDEIHAYDILEHVEDFRASCSEIARCLRQNGLLVIEVPDHHSEMVLSRIHPGYWSEIGHKRTVQLKDLREHLAGFRVRRSRKKRGIQHLLLSYYFRRGGHIASERGRCSNAHHSVERVLGLFDEDYLELFVRQSHSWWAWLFLPVLFSTYGVGRIISSLTPKSLRVELVKEDS